jgi:hypothetical protein
MYAPSNTSIRSDDLMIRDFDPNPETTTKYATNKTQNRMLPSYVGYNGGIDNRCGSSVLLLKNYGLLLQYSLYTKLILSQLVMRRATPLNVRTGSNLISSTTHFLQLKWWGDDLFYMLLFY